MARIDKGNALTTKLLQPGWTYQNDGYGLVTGAARFIVTDGSEGSAVLYGDSHVDWLKVPTAGVDGDNIYTYGDSGPDASAGQAPQLGTPIPADAVGRKTDAAIVP